MDPILDLERVYKAKKRFARNQFWRALTDKKPTEIEVNGLKKAIKWSKKGDLGFFLKHLATFVCWVKEIKE